MLLSKNPYFLLPVFTALLTATSCSTIKRKTSVLDEKYDFIIAGGGTAGLTVADRLSSAFPEKTIIVVEYGEIEYARAVFDPPDVIFGGVSTAPRPGIWSFESLPSPEMNNKTATVLAGKTVGGSSAVNGMYFDRPSSADFDAWAKASSPEWDGEEHKWDWEGVFPYYKKSVTFTQPDDKIQDKYGYTWDMAAYGGSTPIHSSFPPFLWADHFIARDAWKEMGIPELNECAGGNKNGLCWVPTSKHPVTARRSYARLGHYDAVLPRPNYHMLVKHQVVRVVYPNGLLSGAPLVEIRSLADGRFFNLTATAEVIIAAGALHTPTILQRSGIGPRTILETANIPVIIDLPGVGENLQDHGAPPFVWNYTRPGNFSPMPSNMLDPSFAADAAAGFDETPARGPYTLSMSNSGVYVSLPSMSANYTTIIDDIRSIATNGSASSYLPLSEPTLIAGYTRQLLVLADFLANPKAPSIEVPFATGTSTIAILLHPLSRGTVKLNGTDHLEQPVLDYRAGTNPIDFDIHVAHLKYIRRMIDIPSMQRFGAVEVRPGAGVQSDGELREYVKNNIALSQMHPCCTAAMLPRELGGVVGPDLKVHGLKGLRVVDLSVMPFLGSAHTSSTAYALGEKAADIIIEGWRK